MWLSGAAVVHPPCAGLRPEAGALGTGALVHLRHYNSALFCLRCGVAAHRQAVLQGPQLWSVGRVCCVSHAGCATAARGSLGLNPCHWFVQEHRTQPPGRKVLADTH